MRTGFTSADIHAATKIIIGKKTNPFHKRVFTQLFGVFFHDPACQNQLKKRPARTVSRILLRIRVAPNPPTIIHLWTTVTRCLLRPTRELERAALKHSPIWSCTGWGLPSFPGHPENWCALTAPFHPYPFRDQTLPGRSAFCCTCLRVAATPRYGAPCPVVFGLSSGPNESARRSPGPRQPSLQTILHK
jgi:hypothetical protein